MILPTQPQITPGIDAMVPTGGGDRQSTGQSNRINNKLGLSDILEVNRMQIQNLLLTSLSKPAIFTKTLECAASKRLYHILMDISAIAKCILNFLIRVIL